MCGPMFSSTGTDHFERTPNDVNKFSAETHHQDVGVSRSSNGDTTFTFTEATPFNQLQKQR